MTQTDSIRFIDFNLIIEADPFYPNSSNSLETNLQPKMMSTKRMDETYSAGDRSRMLYSQAPTTQYYGGDSNHQSLSNFRSFEGNTDRGPQSHAYLSQYRGQAENQRRNEDVQQQWRDYYATLQRLQYGNQSSSQHPNYGVQSSHQQYGVQSGHSLPLQSSSHYPGTQTQQFSYQNYNSQNQRQQFNPQIPREMSYQRTFLPFRPIMANEPVRVPQSNMPHNINGVNQGSPLTNDFKVFCPACHEEYYNSEVEAHIERHYLYNTEQFKLNSLDALDVTNDSIQPLSLQPKAMYPLVEPLEFECKELDEVNYHNRYKMHSHEQNRKQNHIKVKSASTQFARPPLQKRSNETDLYNCFDNLFNSKNKFSVKDLTKSNKVLATKRQLDDWEAVRSQKEDYTPRITKSKKMSKK